MKLFIIKCKHYANILESLKLQSRTNKITDVQWKLFRKVEENGSKSMDTQEPQQINRSLITNNLNCVIVLLK